MREHTPLTKDEFHRFLSEAVTLQQITFERDEKVRLKRWRKESGRRQHELEIELERFSTWRLLDWYRRRTTPYDLPAKDDLRVDGFSEGTVRRVERLSGRPVGVNYIDNIRNMVSEGDLGVMLIKLSNNEDNADPERIAQLPLEQISMVTRYDRSMKILREGIEAALKTDPVP